MKIERGNDADGTGKDCWTVWDDAQLTALFYTRELAEEYVTLKAGECEIVDLACGGQWCTAHDAPTDHSMRNISAGNQQGECDVMAQVKRMHERIDSVLSEQGECSYLDPVHGVTCVRNGEHLTHWIPVRQGHGENVQITQCDSGCDRPCAKHPVWHGRKPFVPLQPEQSERRIYDENVSRYKLHMPVPRHDGERKP